MLLYFVKSKNDTKCKNFVDLLCMFLCQYINSFVLPEISRRGATAPLAPPKSAIVVHRTSPQYLINNLGAKNSLYS